MHISVVRGTQGGPHFTRTNTVGARSRRAPPHRTACEKPSNNKRWLSHMRQIMLVGRSAQARLAAVAKPLLTIITGDPTNPAKRECNEPRDIFWIPESAPWRTTQPCTSSHLTPTSEGLCVPEAAGHTQHASGSDKAVRTDGCQWWAPIGTVCTIAVAVSDPCGASGGAET
jgi:hypothetical protein